MSAAPHPAAASGIERDNARFQADEHPLIGETRPTSIAEHAIRLMHLRAYAEAAGHARGGDVLDVGCNTGYGTVGFVPVARRVVGIDVSPAAIEAARRRSSAGRPEFLVTTGVELPFPDESFDLVTSFQVVEHLVDPLAFLAELRRVLRPGGVVVLATPNAAIRLDPGMTPWNRFHVREYRAAELAELLAAAFGDVRVRGLFAVPTLYEAELARAAAALAWARRRDARPARAAAPAPRAASSLPRRLGRRVIPRAARTMVRGLLHRSLGIRTDAGPDDRPDVEPATSGRGRGAIASDDEDRLGRFLELTVDDLFYADHDLDRALDLLAVCRPS